MFGRSSASGAQGRSFAEYRAVTGTGRAAGSVGGASRAGSGRIGAGANPNAGKKEGAGPPSQREMPWITRPSVAAPS